MARLTPRFSTNRSVREYTEQHYLSAAKQVSRLVRWPTWRGERRNTVTGERAPKKKWPQLRFSGEVRVQTKTTQHTFEAEVYFNDLDPSAVGVELYADGINDNGPIRQPMTRVRPLTGPALGWIYSGSVSATRLATDYTVRIVPNYAGVAVPLEVAPILWQR